MIKVKINKPEALHLYPALFAGVAYGVQKYKVWDIEIMTHTITDYYLIFEPYQFTIFKERLNSNRVKIKVNHSHPQRLGLHQDSEKMYKLIFVSYD